MSENASDKKRSQRTQNRGEQKHPVPILIALFVEPRGPNDCDHRSAFDQVAVAEENNELIETRGGLGRPIQDAGFWEVMPLAPVPEPSTWIGGALALVTIGFMQRRRIRGLVARRA